MLGKVGGWVVIEGLTHTEFWVEYNLPYVNLLLYCRLVIAINIGISVLMLLV